MENIKIDKDFIPSSNPEVIYYDNYEEKKLENQALPDYKKLPIICKPKTKKELKLEKKEHKKLLKKLKKEKRKEKKTRIKIKWLNVFGAIFLLIIIAFAIMGGYGLFLIKSGKLTPIISQNLSFDPNVQVDAPIANNLDIAPVVNNEYINNYTIINEITCPEQVCVCEES